ncbi:MAG: translation initiation factor IF-3 [Spirochaetes bacterium]|nr:translation initiation factor IF-3 [Spirochaetota bacterium]
MALNNRKPRGKSSSGKEYRTNDMIKAESVRLVGDSDEPIIVTLEKALELAKQSGLDLVEISMQDVPVVRIMDYSKFKFEQVKKAKEAKKKQKIVHLKEVKVRPSIDAHDYEHKVKHAREFLEKGDKVKVTMMFRGREIVHSDLAKRKMEQMLAELSDCSTVEKTPSVEGRNMTMILSPISR